MPNPLINIGAAVGDGTGEIGPRQWLQKVNRLPNADSTINAGSGDYAGTTEQKITAAIAAAVLAGAKYVFVPQSMLPYNASLVTFNVAIRMITEGSNPNDFSVRAYGAKGDGISNDAIAINAAAGNTGRLVYVPAGSYLLNSSIVLSSNTTLVLETGSTLIRNFATLGIGGATVHNGDQVLGNVNISIIGDGVFTVADATKTGHNCSLGLVNGVNISGVRFGQTGNPGMSLTFTDCSNVRVSGILINNGGAGAGTDGIHISGGSNIAIAGCDITSGDDPIGITQESNFCTLDCTDIAISGCRLVGVQNGGMIRLQTYSGQSPSSRAIRRVVISGCVGKSSSQGLVFVDQTNTGILSDILLSNSIYDGSTDVSFPTFNGPARMTLAHVQIRNHSRGVNIVNVVNFKLVDCDISGVRNTNGTEGYGLTLSTSTDLQIIGGRIADAVDGSGSNGNGIQTSGGVATDLLIDGLLIENCARHGIATASSPAGVTIRNCRIKTCGQFGVNIIGGTTSATVTNNDLRGNTSGAITDGGTNTIKRDNRVSTGPISGIAVLVGGTVTVNTAEVLANTIQLTRVITGGTVGHLTVGAVVSGISFVITSSSGTDTSSVFWEIVH